MSHASDPDDPDPLDDAWGDYYHPDPRLRKWIDEHMGYVLHKPSEAEVAKAIDTILGQRLALDHPADPYRLDEPTQCGALPQPSLSGSPRISVTIAERLARMPASLEAMLTNTAHEEFASLDAEWLQLQKDPRT